MTTSTAASEAIPQVKPPSVRLEVLVVDRRALLRHALTSALEAVWSEAIFRKADSYAVGSTEDCLDPAAAVLLGGLGLARNPALREDMEWALSAMPTTPILLLTDHVDAADVAAAIRAGARGYLASDVALAVLIQSLRLLMIGGTAFPGILPASEPCTLASAPDQQPLPRRRPAEATSPVGLFTPKEREVLGGLGEAKPNKIIAYELGICETTVKVHMRHIMRKLGATNRTHAALLASEMLMPVEAIC
jgi:DNA-binding NarL/FixJ family response regulator